MSLTKPPLFTHSAHSAKLSGMRFFLAAALALSAFTASADVTLLAPRAGETLDGGREATLSWEATALPAPAEEWEAFLSLDGGAYYAVRITPHLDRGVRTFRWRVPNVAASHARLLLRVGDGEREHVIELPQTFAIAPRYVPLELPTLQVARSDEAGESARAGGEPSVEWVSSDLVRHRHRDSAASGAPSFRAADPADGAALGSNQTSQRSNGAYLQHVFSRDGPACRDSRAIPIRPLLLLSTRLNV